jgi:MarR family transcriptional regulator for hemolysin
MVVSINRDALRMVGTLTRLSRTLDQRLRHASADDLSIIELSVLGQIERGIDLPSAVARVLQLDPARVTRITDRLVMLGYIEREADVGDRRRCHLRLTDAGAKRVAAGRAELSTAVAELLAGLSDEERTGLMRGLESIRRVLDALPDPYQNAGAHIRHTPNHHPIVSTEEQQ